MEDLRDSILRDVAGRRVVARIIADDPGVVAGTAAVREEARRFGISLEGILSEDGYVRKGDEIAKFCGSPKQVLVAGEIMIGLLAKPSGIATAAHKAVELAQGKPKIVCGAWKKIPLPVKEMYRKAVVTGGALCRISADPFVYLDKNYVEIFGGVKESLRAVKHLNGYLKVVQLTGKYKDIALEAFEAAESGAAVLFVDTGRSGDVKLVIEKLLQLGLRNRVSIAFGGGIRLKDINELKALDIDILCVGRQIIDAPLLDMRLEIVGTADGDTGEL